MKPQNMILINLIEDDAKLLRSLLGKLICNGVPIAAPKDVARILNQIEEQL